MGERDGVEPLHLGLIPGRKRDHRAVAHARRLTVERAGTADAGAARPAPGDDAVEFHSPLRPPLHRKPIITGHHPYLTPVSMLHITPIPLSTHSQNRKYS